MFVSVKKYGSISDTIILYTLSPSLYIRKDRVLADLTCS